MKLPSFSKGLSHSLPGFILLFFILQCSSKNKKDDVHYIIKVWRINPSSTVLNKSTQFFISGKYLDSVKITAGETVHIERGKVTGMGTKQQLMIKVDPFVANKESDYADKPGKREIRIHTGKKPEKLFLTILDEDPKSEIVDMELKPE